MIKTTQNSKVLRWIAGCTLFFFVSTQNLFAMPEPASLFLRSPEKPPALIVDIPMDMGSVTDIYEAPKNSAAKVVFQIENAHAHYGAQDSIRKLLHYLNEKYQVRDLFLEGAASEVHSRFFQVLNDKKKNFKLADTLAKKGLMTGAELFLLETSQPPVRAFGIEQVELYKKNYEALKDVLGDSKAVDDYLDACHLRFDRLSSRLLSPEARSLLKEWERFEDGRREFLPMVQSLAQDAKKILNLDLRSLFSQLEWPQITRLLSIQELEKELNIEKAESEKERLLDFLRKRRMSKELIRDIESFVVSKNPPALVRTGSDTRQEGPRYLLERLSEEASPKGFYFYEYPYFSLYAGYVILLSELESRELFMELGHLFDRLIDAAIQKEGTGSQNSKNLSPLFVALWRRTVLLKKLLRLELSREEWNKTEMDLPEINVSIIQDELAAFEKRMGITQGTGCCNLSPGLFQRACDFYRLALEREQVLYQSMDRIMKERGLNRAVLIGGGFHTEGFQSQLRKGNMSFVTLTPNMPSENENARTLYRESMLETRTPVLDHFTLERIPFLMKPRVQKSQGANLSVRRAEIRRAMADAGLSREEGGWKRDDGRGFPRLSSGQEREEGRRRMKEGRQTDGASLSQPSSESSLPKTHEAEPVTSFVSKIRDSLKLHRDSLRPGDKSNRRLSQKSSGTDNRRGLPKSVLFPGFFWYEGKDGGNPWLTDGFAYRPFFEWWQGVFDKSSGSSRRQRFSRLKQINQVAWSAVSENLSGAFGFGSRLLQGLPRTGPEPGLLRINLGTGPKKENETFHRIQIRRVQFLKGLHQFLVSLFDFHNGKYSTAKLNGPSQKTENPGNQAERVSRMDTRLKRLGTATWTASSTRVSRVLISVESFFRSLTSSIRELSRSAMVLTSLRNPSISVPTSVGEYVLLSMGRSISGSMSFVDFYFPNILRHYYQAKANAISSRPSKGRAGKRAERHSNGQELQDATGGYLTLEQAYQFLKENTACEDWHFMKPEDLEDAKILMEEIAELPIEKVMVVGNGSVFLPLFMILMGKEVVLDDAAPQTIEIIQDFIIPEIKENLKKNRRVLDLKFRSVCSEIGRLNLEKWGLESHSFDMVTFIDLIGGLPVGEPLQWIEKSKELLKRGGGYLVIDEDRPAKPHLSLPRALQSVFVKSQLLADGVYFQGAYNSPDSKNRLYRVDSGYSISRSEARSKGMSRRTFFKTAVPAAAQTVLPQTAVLHALPMEIRRKAAALLGYYQKTSSWRTSMDWKKEDIEKFSSLHAEVGQINLVNYPEVAQMLEGEENVFKRMLLECIERVEPRHKDLYQVIRVAMDDPGHLSLFQEIQHKASPLNESLSSPLNIQVIFDQARSQGLTPEDVKKNPFNVLFGGRTKILAIARQEFDLLRQKGIPVSAKEQLKIIHRYIASAKEAIQKGYVYGGFNSPTEYFQKETNCIKYNHALEVIRKIKAVVTKRFGVPSKTDFFPEHFRFWDVPLSALRPKMSRYIHGKMNDAAEYRREQILKQARQTLEDLLQKGHLTKNQYEEQQRSVEARIQKMTRKELAENPPEAFAQEVESRVSSLQSNKRNRLPASWDAWMMRLKRPALPAPQTKSRLPESVLGRWVSVLALIAQKETVHLRMHTRNPGRIDFIEWDAGIQTFCLLGDEINRFNEELFPYGIELMRTPFVYYLEIPPGTPAQAILDFLLRKDWWANPKAFEIHGKIHVAIQLGHDLDPSKEEMDRAVDWLIDFWDNQPRHASSAQSGVVAVSMRHIVRNYWKDLTGVLGSDLNQWPAPLSLKENEQTTLLLRRIMAPLWISLSRFGRIPEILKDFEAELKDKMALCLKENKPEIRIAVFGPGWMQQPVEVLASVDKVLETIQKESKDTGVSLPAVNIFVIDRPAASTEVPAGKPSSVSLESKIRRNEIVYDPSDVAWLEESGIDPLRYLEKTAQGYKMRPETHERFHLMFCDLNQPEGLDTLGLEPLDFVFFSEVGFYIEKNALRKTMEFLYKAVQDDGLMYGAMSPGYFSREWRGLDQPSLEDLWRQLPKHGSDDFRRPALFKMGKVLGPDSSMNPRWENRLGSMSRRVFFKTGGFVAAQVVAPSSLLPENCRGLSSALQKSIAYVLSNYQEAAKWDEEDYRWEIDYENFSTHYQRVKQADLKEYPDIAQFLKQEEAAFRGHIRASIENAEPEHRDLYQGILVAMDDPEHLAVFERVQGIAHIFNHGIRGYLNTYEAFKKALSLKLSPAEIERYAVKILFGGYRGVWPIAQEALDKLRQAGIPFDLRQIKEEVRSYLEVARECIKDNRVYRGFDSPAEYFQSLQDRNKINFILERIQKAGEVAVKRFGVPYDFIPTADGYRFYWNFPLDEIKKQTDSLIRQKMTDAAEYRRTEILKKAKEVLEEQREAGSLTEEQFTTRWRSIESRVQSMKRSDLARTPPEIFGREVQFSIWESLWDQVIQMRERILQRLRQPALPAPQTKRLLPESIPPGKVVSDLALAAQENTVLVRIHTDPARQKKIEWMEWKVEPMPGWISLLTDEEMKKFNEKMIHPSGIALPSVPYTYHVEIPPGTPAQAILDFLLRKDWWKDPKAFEVHGKIHVSIQLGHGFSGTDPSVPRKEIRDEDSKDLHRAGRIILPGYASSKSEKSLRIIQAALDQDRKGNTPQAIQMLRARIKKDPACVVLQEALIRIFLRHHQYSDARMFLDQTAQPFQFQVIKNLTEEGKREMSPAKKNYGLARQYFQYVMELKPDDKVAPMFMGDTYLDEQQWETARVWYLKALAKNPSNREILNRMIRSYREEKNYPGMVEWLSRDLESMPVGLAEKKKIRMYQKNTVVWLQSYQTVFESPLVESLKTLLSQAKSILEKEEVQGILQDDILATRLQALGDPKMNGKIFKEQGVGYIPKIQGGQLLVWGDLHADLDSFQRVMSQEHVWDRLASGRPLYLVFLGDYLTGGRRPLELLEAMLKLKVRFPDHVMFLRGDHDKESRDLFYEFLSQREDLSKPLFEFFLQMPSVAVTGNGLILSHIRLPPDTPSSLKKIAQHQTSLLSVETMIPTGYKGNFKRILNELNAGAAVSAHFHNFGQKRIYEGTQAILITTRKESPDTLLPQWLGSEDGVYGVFKLDTSYQAILIENIRRIEAASNRRDPQGRAESKASNETELSPGEMPAEEQFQYFMTGYARREEFSREVSLDEQARWRAGDRWFKELDVAKRNALFREIANQRAAYKDNADLCFYEQDWFNTLGEAILGWIRDGWVGPDILKETEPLWQVPKRSFYAPMRGTILATYLAVASKAWEAEKDPDLQKAIVERAILGLETAQVKDLRQAFDYLTDYLGKYWLNFVEHLRSEKWAYPVLDLWKKEMGWLSRENDLGLIQRDMPIYYAISYLRDGSGDVHIAWRNLQALRRRYPENPVYFIMDSRILERWLPRVDARIQPDQMEQQVDGIHILAFKSRKIGDSQYVRGWIPEDLRDIELHTQISNDYVHIAHLPGSWMPPGGRETRTLRLGDYDHDNFGTTIGELDHDFLPSGFMHGTLGISRDTAYEGPALLQHDPARNGLLKKLGVETNEYFNFKDYPWAVAYIHSKKGLADYVHYLKRLVEERKVDGPVLLFMPDIPDKGPYWNRMDAADPFSGIPGAAMFPSFEKITFFPGTFFQSNIQVWIIPLAMRHGSFSLPKEVFQELLMASDVPPKIRGAASMSFLFTRSKPFLLEAVLGFLNNINKGLDSRARAAGVSWNPETEPVSVSEASLSLQKVFASRPWDLAEGLTVYTDYLLAGKDVPSLPRKLRIQVLRALLIIMAASELHEKQNLSEETEKLILEANDFLLQMVETHSEVLVRLKEELNQEDGFYDLILADIPREKVMEQIDEILELADEPVLARQEVRQDGGKKPAGSTTMSPDPVSVYDAAGMSASSDLGRSETREITPVEAIADLGESKYVIPYREKPLDFKAVFGNDHPVWISLGVGKGEAEIEMAKRRPGINFLLVEKEASQDGVIAGLEKEQLQNTRLIQGHSAQDVFRFMIPKNSVERIYAVYPDPWREGYFSGNREVFLNYLEALKANGQFLLITERENILEFVRTNFQEVVATESSRFVIKDPMELPFVTDVQKAWYLDYPYEMTHETDSMVNASRIHLLEVANVAAADSGGVTGSAGLNAVSPADQPGTASNASGFSGLLRENQWSPQGVLTRVMQALATIQMSELKDGDLRGAVEETVKSILPHPVRGSSATVGEYYDMMARGEPLIPNEANIPPPIETEFGRIDLHYLNHPQAEDSPYRTWNGAVLLARDLHLAHLIGLITIQRFNGASSQTACNCLRTMLGVKQVKFVSATWPDALVLQSAFERIRQTDDLLKYAGDEGQIQFYLDWFGDKAKDKHAGNLYSAISSVIQDVEGLKWSKMPLNLGDVISLRKEIEGRKKEPAWIAKYRGDSGQLQFYVDWFKDKAKDKHAGALYSAISSMIQDVEGLNWRMMNLNLGDVIALRKEIEIHEDSGGVTDSAGLNAVSLDDQPGTPSNASSHSHASGFSRAEVRQSQQWTARVNHVNGKQIMPEWMKGLSQEEQAAFIREASKILSRTEVDYLPLESQFHLLEKLEKSYRLGVQIAKSQGSQATEYMPRLAGDWLTGLSYAAIYKHLIDQGLIQADNIKTLLDLGPGYGNYLYLYPLIFEGLAAYYGVDGDQEKIRLFEERTRPAFELDSKKFQISPGDFFQMSEHDGVNEFIRQNGKPDLILMQSFFLDDEYDWNDFQDMLGHLGEALSEQGRFIMIIDQQDFGLNSSMAIFEELLDESGFVPEESERMVFIPAGLGKGQIIPQKIYIYVLNQEQLLEFKSETREEKRVGMRGEARLAVNVEQLTRVERRNPGAEIKVSVVAANFAGPGRYETRLSIVEEIKRIFTPEQAVWIQKAKDVLGVSQGKGSVVHLIDHLPDENELAGVRVSFRNPNHFEKFVVVVPESELEAVQQQKEKILSQEREWATKQGLDIEKRFMIEVVVVGGVTERARLTAVSPDHQPGTGSNASSDRQFVLTVSPELLSYIDIDRIPALVIETEPWSDPGLSGASSLAAAEIADRLHAGLLDEKIHQYLTPSGNYFRFSTVSLQTLSDLIRLDLASVLLSSASA